MAFGMHHGFSPCANLLAVTNRSFIGVTAASHSMGLFLNENFFPWLLWKVFDPHNSLLLIGANERKSTIVSLDVFSRWPMLLPVVQ